MINEITVQELKKLKDENAEFFLLDVRDPFEYEISNLGGHLIPLTELPHRLDEIDQTTPMIIVHCKMGGRSLRAAEFLDQQGFANVYNLVGGLSAWVNEIEPGMPK